MARIEINIGDGANKLDAEISSWFAKDTANLTKLFLDKIQPISVKDMIDVRVANLMENNSIKIDGLKAEIRDWQNRYDKLERRKTV